ncbi:MAG: hypothetical protein RBT71_01935 [Flavobacteriales bacterium]|jgi:hypothetical protein|nr:hypothetical protein [Flavobacteriales bacterium]
MMAQQRFHTTMQWHNTRAALWVAAFLALGGVILLALRNEPLALWGPLAVAGLILAVAIYRDRGDRCSYVLTDEHLVLKRSREQMVVPLGSIMDASLVDRKAARDYFGSIVVKRERSMRRRRRLRQEFLRYCTVGIGLRPFGLAPARNGMNSARHDLVLLRTRDHGVRLLSPVYNQDMVSALTRHALRTAPADQL